MIPPFSNGFTSIPHVSRWIVLVHPCAGRDLRCPEMTREVRQDEHSPPSTGAATASSSLPDWNRIDVLGDDIKVGLTWELHTRILWYERTFPYRHARIGSITSRETNSRGLYRADARRSALNPL